MENKLEVTNLGKAAPPSRTQNPHRRGRRGRRDTQEKRKQGGRYSGAETVTSREDFDGYHCRVIACYVSTWRLRPPGRCAVRGRGLPRTGDCRSFALSSLRA